MPRAIAPVSPPWVSSEHQKLSASGSRLVAVDAASIAGSVEMHCAADCYVRRATPVALSRRD